MTPEQRKTFLRSLTPEQHEAVREIVRDAVHDTAERVKEGLLLSAELADCRMILGDPAISP